MALKVNDLVSFVKKAYLEDWGYVLGAQGETWSKELAEKWAVTRNKPSSWIGTKRSYFVDACARWFGHKVADCSGLIIAAFRECKNPKYTDKNANTLYDRCVKKGKISTIPEKPGLCVWKKGHIGIYIGGGYAIESRGYKYGVVKTKVKDRPWTNWGELKDVDYSAGSVGGAPVKEMPLLKKGMYNNPDVRTLQKELNNHGGDLKVDGDFGSLTEKAVKSFQKKMKIKVDGIVGPVTWGKLLA
jgi:hypothetical protein